jgi:hypothetical protein
MTHVADPALLERTIGYFDDPRVAVVQTPQEFYNHDSFEHDAAIGDGERFHEQALFYRMLQPGKNRWVGALWCGTGAMQVLRFENPVTATGLSVPQRLAYATTLVGWFDAWRTLGFATLPILVVVPGVGDRPGRTLDVSTTGARVVLHGALPIGHGIRLSFDLDHEVVGIDGIVRSTRDDEAGRSVHGVEFAAGQHSARARLALGLFRTRHPSRVDRATAPAAPRVPEPALLPA